jgi:hypothetical protein
VSMLPCRLRGNRAAGSSCLRLHALCATRAIGWQAYMGPHPVRKSVVSKNGWFGTPRHIGLVPIGLTTYPALRRVFLSLGAVYELV